MKAIIVWLLLGYNSLHGGNTAVSALYDRIECQRLGEQLMADRWITEFRCYPYEMRSADGISND